ncbi:ferritin-like metal-binding protein YciE [Mucilaginibacter oryzae]|uniref:Ferritin-like metal-binding protein YciE n=1 Tax=Mucilaginibacter oryzae TaxID=468058 RepID=A0A316HG73_9SPHI|nr:DUF892 family protein [Mucilaginibacter oryzae]PWK77235.1 ferritin-like metal-binding protein YciE [Mucilaginibacter oryzae]
MIYAAKSHLVSKLPEILDEVHYHDLRKGILETVEDVLKQMVRVEMIFELLGEKMTAERCPGMIGMIEEAFQAIKRHKGRDHGLRDLAIANYMQQIESVEVASFQILEMAAVKIRNKQIRKLLKENYDEARADRTLMLLIATKYIVAK